MGNIRLEMAKRMDIIDTTLDKVLWVTDFPLFEYDEDSKRYYAMHHPFTSPAIEDIDKMESAPGDVKAQAYDLVWNGNEIAGKTGTAYVGGRARVDFRLAAPRRARAP